MPISCDHKIVPMTQDAFVSIDYKLMELAFSIHNEFGRFCNESVYESELRHRCIESGFEQVATQVPIRVSHAAFSKTLYADLLINGGALYELKATESLVPKNRAQTLTYLMLLELNHGKLLNWRPSSLQHEFVSTQLTLDRRRKFRADSTRWKPVAPHSKGIYELILALVSDWGLFLQTSLLMEAVAFLHKDISTNPEPVDVVHEGRIVGRQFMHLMGPESGFVLSSTPSRDHYETHLRRLLQHTNLCSIQWVNVAHHDVSFITLEHSKNKNMS